MISKIEKQKPKPVLKPGVAHSEDLLQASQISYYKIPAEIKGNFLSYIKFKSCIKVKEDVKL